MFEKIKVWFMLKIMSIKFAIKIININRVVKSPTLRSVVYHKIFKKVNDAIETENFSADYFIDNHPVWVDYYENNEWEYVGLVCPGIANLGVVSPFVVKVKNSLTDVAVGYLIILPTSFKDDPELEKFVIHHELGHIYFGDLENTEVGECIHDDEKEFRANRFACERLKLSTSVAEEHIRHMGKKILIDTAMFVGADKGKTLDEFIDYIELLLSNNKGINKEINDIRKFSY